MDVLGHHLNGVHVKALRVVEPTAPGSRCLASSTFFEEARKAPGNLRPRPECEYAGRVPMPYAQTRCQRFTDGGAD
jgi:hypothetical protein